jgi:Tol biopolymer transport system component
LHVKALGDEASGQPLVPPQFPQIACDWSKTPDGEFIVYESGSPESGADLFAVPVSGNRTPRPFVRSRFNETDARFSPDGRRVVYVSDESGRREVYVRPFANGTEHRQVSIAGGSSPRWSRNGREVFYLGRDGRLMSVTVSSTSLDTSAPKALFTIGAPDAGYEVSPDGQRFLVNRLSGRSIVTVVVDWLSAVRR